MLALRSSRARVLLLLVVTAACGSRTALFGDEPPEGEVAVADASRRDTSSDGPVPEEAGMDARRSFDALPLIDATPRLDVNRADCPDAEATLVYLVTSQHELYAFYPPALSFRLVGNLECPIGPGGATPFSMAVDRRGSAYVLYTDGRLFRVSTLDASCTATSYRPNQNGFSTFGMGFAADDVPGNERLFVAESGGFQTPGEERDSTGLASIDTTSLVLSFVGVFNPPIPRAEFTGNADGRLFAYWPVGTSQPQGYIAEIDKRSGEVQARSEVPVGSRSDAFAFAFWGGDFWMFNSDGMGPTALSRFRPLNGSTITAATFPSSIVGAGVSTCAPAF